MIGLRLLTEADLAAAARIHRAAQATIPGYPIDLHSLAEHVAFYRHTVWPAGPITGAFEGAALRGFVATRPGWIDHLYVDPSFHGRGIGRLLLDDAMSDAPELRLWTFQANAPARTFYERAGFVAEAFTDGDNEERLPDMRYGWRRGY